MKSIGQLIVSYTGNVVSLTINLLWMWWWFCIWFVLFISFINCAFINLEDSHFYAIYLSCPTCIMCKSCHIVCWSYPILYLVKNKIVILYQWILSNYSKFPFFTLFSKVSWSSVFLKMIRQLRSTPCICWKLVSALCWPSQGTPRQRPRLIRRPRYCIRG